MRKLPSPQQSTTTTTKKGPSRNNDNNNNNNNNNNNKCPVSLKSFLLAVLGGILFYRSSSLGGGGGGGWTTTTTTTSSSSSGDNNKASTKPQHQQQQHQKSSSSFFTPYYRQLYKYHAPSQQQGLTTTTKPIQSNTTTNVTDDDDDECGEGPDFQKFFDQDMKVRSRLNEDKNIYEYFFKNKNRQNKTTTESPLSPSSSSFTYLEIGAFDGKQESNSRFFDVCLGWDGLLVEANPMMYPRLIENRPNAHRVSLAASCSKEQAEQNDTIGFIDSIFTNAAQVDTVNAEAYKERPKDPVQVPCGPLTPIILDLFPNGGHVTFFSLDVEGAEPKVLQNIDFDLVQIDIFMVENFNNFCTLNNCPSRDEFRRILESKGYVWTSHKIQRSDLFVHQNSTFIMDFQNLS